METHALALATFSLPACAAPIISKFQPAFLVSVARGC